MIKVEVREREKEEEELAPPHLFSSLLHDAHFQVEHNRYATTL